MYSHSFVVTSNALVAIVPPPLLTRKVQVVSHFKGDVPFSFQLLQSLIPPNYVKLLYLFFFETEKEDLLK